MYRGGVSLSSRNSSILLTSTLTSPLNVMKGGLVPGAKSCKSAGFLTNQNANTSGYHGKQCQENYVLLFQIQDFFHVVQTYMNEFYRLRSTVVTLKVTPFNNKIIKSL